MFAPPGKMIGFGQLSIYPFRCQAKCTEHVPGRPCIPANSARYAIKMPPEWRGLPGRGGRPAQDVAEYCAPCFDMCFPELFAEAQKGVPPAPAPTFPAPQNTAPAAAAPHVLGGAHGANA